MTTYGDFQNTDKQYMVIVPLFIDYVVGSESFMCRFNRGTSVRLVVVTQKVYPYVDEGGKKHELRTPSSCFLSFRVLHRRTESSLRQELLIPWGIPFDLMLFSSLLSGIGPFLLSTGDGSGCAS